MHEVVAVLTRPDAPAGRGRRLSPSPVAELALEAGVEVLRPVKLSSRISCNELRELDVDCAPVVAFGALLREPALSMPRHGWVNLHFSLLPAWRGAAPVQHALLHGDDTTGASTFQIGPGLDDGPVYGVMTERIRPTDTSGDLLDRLAVAGAPLLVATLDGIADGSLRPQPQPADGVSHAPKLTVADAEIRFDQPARHSTGGSGPAPRSPGPGPPSAATGSSSARCRPARARRPAPGRGARRPGRRAGRHRHRAGRARHRAAGRQAADAGRRLGQRRPPRAPARRLAE